MTRDRAPWRARPALARARRSLERAHRAALRLATTATGTQLDAVESRLRERLEALTARLSVIEAQLARIDGLESARAGSMVTTRDAVAALAAEHGELARAVDNLGQLTALGFERQAWSQDELDEVRAGAAWSQAYTEREPLVTVRIATYNRSKILTERTLPSVLRQSYERWEVVVVGDACTDDTSQRVRALADPRIRFHNLTARGPYPSDRHQRWLVAGIPAMNDGARAAKGAWIAPLDDDDEWTEDHLEVLLGAARADRSEVAYGSLLARLADPPLEAPLGSWPPRHGDFAWQSAIYNAALRGFEYDMACRFLDEPGDWNLARRMWDAGVRFTFVEQIVGTYNVTESNDAVIGWFHSRAVPVEDPE